MRFLIKRLLSRRIWNKIWKERLTEPLHLNILSVFVYLFGSFRKKVAFDLVLRPHHAYGLLEAATNAKDQGLKQITVLEFGVANGAGLMNMIAIAKKVEKTTGVSIKIIGFDTGKGMPEPIDFRDHPELYNTGDFPMNREALEQAIAEKATILYGNIEDTISEFAATVSKESPIGFISIDVDYYSSTLSVFKALTLPPNCFLPLTYLYFDDISQPNHNQKCGELLAIKEFNAQQELRQIEYHPFFEKNRIFKNSNWTKQLYFFHVLDHPKRFNIDQSGTPNVLDNPYLSFEGNKKTFVR